MNKAKSACLLPLALLVGALPVLAAQDDASPAAAFFKHLQARKTVFDHFLFLAGPDVQNDENLKGFAAQLLATDYSFLGRPNDAIRVFPIHRRDAPPPSLPDHAHYEAMPAANWITERSTGYRVVMINEAHHFPQTRLLTLELLAKLRRLGFTHFAAETFAPGDDLLAAGYPTPETGYYTREPVFAELVRQARRLGYVLVPYEPESRPGQTQQERETGMAQTLADLAKAHPDARLLVHAGYGHVAKSAGTQPGSADPMAREFIRLTGLAVLSIDQTGLGWEDGRVASRLAGEFGIAAPSVLLAREDGHVWSERPERHDASVLLPAADTTVLRPDWLALDGRRRPIVIDMTPCHGRLPCLAEARYASEGKDAIPADQFVMLAEDEVATPLYLAPGKYRLRLTGNDGAILSERELGVASPSRADDR